MIHRVVRLAVIVLAAASSARAHDFWIEPSTFHPAAGKVFSASLRVGQDFLGDPVPRSSELIDSFVVRDASGDHDVIGFENRDPAGFVNLERGGGAVIGYRSKGAVLDGTPEKFAKFLREEGLERFAPSGKYRERFFRYAKTVVGTGTRDARFGYRLELIVNPANGSASLLFEDKPLAGALVTAIARDDAARVSARTDAKGRVTLALPHKGVWLVKSTWLVAAPPGSGFDWESLWASVTFER